MRATLCTSVRSNTEVVNNMRREADEEKLRISRKGHRKLRREGGIKGLLTSAWVLSELNCIS